MAKRLVQSTRAPKVSKTRVSTYMDPSIKKRFIAFCATQGRSQVKQLEIALTHYMDRHEEDQGK